MTLFNSFIPIVKSVFQNYERAKRLFNASSDIAIFGAGEGGKRVADFLNQKKKRALFFIDDFEKGEDIYTLEEIPKIPEVIFIATANKDYINSIVNKLCVVLNYSKTKIIFSQSISLNFSNNQLNQAIVLIERLQNGLIVDEEKAGVTIKYG